MAVVLRIEIFTSQKFFKGLHGEVCLLHLSDRRRRVELLDHHLEDLVNDFGTQLLLVQRHFFIQQLFDV
jgi:hypothetical protein